MSGVEPQQGGLREYLDILRRSRWLVLQAVVLVPLAAIAVSFLQEVRYEASAKVLLSRQNLASSLNGIQDPAILQESAEFLATQAEVARTPIVARRALDRAHVRGRSPRDLLDASSVKPTGDSDVLVFTVEDADPSLAESLAGAYAASFARYRRELDTRALTRARLQLAGRLERLRRARQGRSALYATLAGREEQLRTMEALQSQNGTTLGPPTRAEQTQPKLVRNGILGLLLGLVVGIGLAFLRNSLDTSVRSAEEIEAALGRPLLGRLPPPPSSLGKEELTMLADPYSPEAEAFRVLRANIEFTALARGAKTLLVTSALEREGKSTTAANLAVALAKGGKQVVLVDLDLRRPMLNRFFGVAASPGLTDAALGQSRISRAIVQVPAASWPNGNDPTHLARESGLEPTLALLPSGAPGPNPGELVGSRTLIAVLEELKAHFDVVIVDSPPFLQISDPVVLMGAADGLILVTRRKSLRRPMLREIRRTIDTARANLLGYVLTDVTSIVPDAYAYRAYGGDGLGGAATSNGEKPKRTVLGLPTGRKVAR